MAAEVTPTRRWHRRSRTGGGWRQVKRLIAAVGLALFASTVLAIAVDDGSVPKQGSQYGSET
jgi:hypothetical protein